MALDDPFGSLGRLQRENEERQRRFADEMQRRRADEIQRNNEEMQRRFADELQREKEERQRRFADEQYSKAMGKLDAAKGFQSYRSTVPDKWAYDYEFNKSCQPPLNDPFHK